MDRVKRLQRMSGFLQARLPELGLEAVEDPRKRQGLRWVLAPMLRVVLLGLMAGKKSLAELESSAAWLSPTMRKAMGLPKRVADTTLRDLLCKLPWKLVRTPLHQAVQAARRRKALPIQTLPFHMLSLDGKVTALPTWDGAYAQRHQPDPDSPPHGLIRTVTATLVTAPGKPCIDVTPIRASTNEMGHFPKAFGEAVRIYGNLFDLVSYDAGAGSEKNGRIVRKAGKHYLFRLNDERWELYQLASQLLSNKETVAEEISVLSNRKQVRRRLRLFSVNRETLPTLARKASVWSHARLLLEVEASTIEDEVCVSTERKLYISSLTAETLTPAQWLFATVAHWGVETTHKVLDCTFEEDDRPWIAADPNGMLVVLILRRIAYTLYRARIPGHKFELRGIA